MVVQNLWYFAKSESQQKLKRKIFLKLSVRSDLKTVKYFARSAVIHTARYHAGMI